MGKRKDMGLDRDKLEIATGEERKERTNTQFWRRYTRQEMHNREETSA